MDVTRGAGARLAAAAAVLAAAGEARGFSQRSPVTPIGHESLTTFGWARDAAMDPDSPGAQASARLDSADPVGRPARAAILGVRWADLMGYAFINPFGGTYACFDAVAQANFDVQYDHALRSDYDAGEEGRRRTMVATISRARRHFLRALRTPASATLSVRDGGAAVDRYTNVDARYFYIGLALHPIQDAYSPEHSRRAGRDLDLAAIDAHTRADRFIWVDASNYTCEPTMWQHSHATPPRSADTNRDVIWLTSGNGVDDTHPYGRTPFLQGYARAAVDATQAVFRAFRMASGIGATEIERVAFFDREVASRYLAFALDEAWVAPPPGALCSADDARAMRETLAQVECTREQCLAGLEASNPGLRITDLRAPIDYNAMSFSPSSCTDATYSYSH